MVSIGTWITLVVVGAVAMMAVIFRKELGETGSMIGGGFQALGSGIGGGIGLALSPQIRPIFVPTIGLKTEGLEGVATVLGPPGAPPTIPACYTANCRTLGSCPPGYYCDQSGLVSQCCPDATTTRSGTRNGGTTLYIPPSTTRSPLCEYPIEALRLGVRCD